MEFFSNLNLPMLTGVSRKSMIYKVLDCTAAEALNGTTALHMMALANGSKILRVHDVKQAQECVQLYNVLVKDNWAQNLVLFSIFKKINESWKFLRISWILAF